MEPKGLLIDVTQCIGCGGCTLACQETNGLPVTDEPPTALSSQNYCALQEHDGKYVRRLCMHCKEPACASACPVGALHKTGQAEAQAGSLQCMHRRRTYLPSCS